MRECRFGLNQQKKHVLHFPRVCVGPFRYLSYLPQSKDLQEKVRLISSSKLPVGVNVSLSGCLTLYVSCVMNWRLVQAGCTPPPPNISWARFQPRF